MKHLQLVWMNLIGSSPLALQLLDAQKWMRILISFARASEMPDGSIWGRRCMRPAAVVEVVDTFQRRLLLVPPTTQPLFSLRNHRYLLYLLLIHQSHQPSLIQIGLALHPRPAKMISTGYLVDPFQSSVVSPAKILGLRRLGV